MRCRVFIAFILAQYLALAVIIDQIAIVVGSSIIKDSDIGRDIRVTDFLNKEPLNFSNAARKEAASRLMDQIFIRHEINLGGYSRATPQEAAQELDKLKHERYRTDSAFQAALRRYDLTDLELRTQFQWQLTVLRFIDARFRPAVLITDAEVGNYYREHAASLRDRFPGKSPDELREEARTALTEQKINQQFFSWLDQQRKNTKIRYLEENLR
ncbi:MAG TPA: hypothetical protein VFB14_10060 [Bryobacteraceae bacterium]|jgi:hypothetical protein|nr:hypothetical protein [Bryobacteraceae bacterium]